MIPLELSRISLDMGALRRPLIGMVLLIVSLSGLTAFGLPGRKRRASSGFHKVRDEGRRRSHLGHGGFACRDVATPGNATSRGLLLPPDVTPASPSQNLATSERQAKREWATDARENIQVSLSSARGCSSCGSSSERSRRSDRKRLKQTEADRRIPVAGHRACGRTMTRPGPRLTRRQRRAREAPAAGNATK